MKAGDVILVDKWRIAGPKVGTRNRAHTQECRACKNDRVIMLLLGVLPDSGAESDLDANKLLEDLGWTPPMEAKS